MTQSGFLRGNIECVENREKDGGEGEGEGGEIAWHDMTGLPAF